MSHPTAMIYDMHKHLFDLPSLRPHSVRPHSVHVAPVRVRHRSDVVRWALERGHPVDRDAMAAIVATRLILIDGSICTRWAVNEVDSLLSWGAANWCRSRGVRVPNRLAPTLDTYLRYLAANNLLDPKSDQMALLRRAVAQNPTTRPSAHPSRMSRPQLAPVLPLW